METNRVILCSTRGVRQEVEFVLSAVDGGYCIKSEHRIAGCYPKPGPCIATPLERSNAVKWLSSRTGKMARSPAAFRPASSIEDHIAAMFGV